MEDVGGEGLGRCRRGVPYSRGCPIDGGEDGGGYFGYVGGFGGEFGKVFDGSDLVELLEVGDKPVKFWTEKPEIMTMGQALAAKLETSARPWTQAAGEVAVC
ncbi:hypothetical protein ABFS83_03G027800 [Erythranthe nasuta]